jgi:hypothetical protein
MTIVQQPPDVPIDDHIDQACDGFRCPEAT